MLHDIIISEAHVIINQQCFCNCRIVELKGMPMKKQPELTAQTRYNFVRAYFELRARGEKTTVGAVSTLAGYNRCTFYRYFADTEHLLSEIETEICDAFKEVLPKDSITTIPSEIVGSLAAIYQKYGSCLSILLGKHGDPQFVSRMKSIIHPIAAQLFSLTSETSIITELKVEFALSAILATITKWYDMNQPVPAEELGLMIKKAIQNGVL